jgi:hypothetical protein
MKLRNLIIAMLAMAIFSGCAMRAQNGPTVHKVIITGTPSTSTGVTAYCFYRSTISGGPYTAITNPCIPAGTPPTVAYTDTAVVGGTTYYYVATSQEPCSPAPCTPIESAWSNQTNPAVVPASPNAPGLNPPTISHLENQPGEPTKNLPVDVKTINPNARQTIVLTAKVR